MTSQNEFEKMIADVDADRIHHVINSLPTSETVRILLNLGEKEREQFFRMLSPDDAARILRAVPKVETPAVISQLSDDDAVKVLENFDSHEQAEILHQSDVEEMDRIIQAMDESSANRLRLIHQYPDNSAGGLMNAELLTVRSGQTVGDFLRKLVAEKEKHASSFKFYPFVVDHHGRLIGVLSVLQLLGEPSGTPVDQLMTEPTSVHAKTTVEELDVIFKDTGYFSLPVVDDDRMLIGTVFHEVVSEHLLEEVKDEALKAQGIITEELRSMPVMLRSRRRLAWLSANIVLNIIAASVISAYEQTLAAVIAIAVFLPMVSDMSGCSGNQAVAVSMRELALGLVKPIDMFRVWLKEISVGLINGVALGVLIAMVAWIWKGNGYLGLVIGLALTLNTMIAVSIGGTVPLLLKRFGIDPAVASGPLLTTITDMAGFFLVLSLAQMMMPLLIV